MPIIGGIENHVRTLAERQVAAGHQVTVLVTNPAGLPTKETINGVAVLRSQRLLTVASTPISLSLPVHLRRLRPDITHLHFPYPLGEMSQWFLGSKRPFVITYHSDIVKQQRILRLYRPLLHRILRLADRILPTSSPYIQSSPFLGAFSEKCTVVPLAVDAAPFLNPTPLLPKNGRLRLLFVGQHRYYKGVDDLIQAMPTIDAELLIGGDGPLRRTWERLAQMLGVADKVHFLGRVSDEDLPRLYTSADIFVLPANSRAEAFGKVLLEAMAAALPCITTEVGSGTSYVVQHNKTGLIVPPNRPDLLSASVNELLSNTRRRVEMGQAGQVRVLAHFTVEKMVSRVLKIYDEVLSADK